MLSNVEPELLSRTSINPSFTSFIGSWHTGDAR